MELRLFAPEDGEAEADAEGEHVEEGFDQKGVRAGLVETDRVEARHDDGRGNTERNHDGAERCAEPAQGAVHAHMMGADQCGLKNKGHNPAGECGRVDPEEEGSRQSRMEKVFVDSMAETPYDNGCDEQRHDEVEILVQQTVSAGDMALWAHK